MSTSLVVNSTLFAGKRLEAATSEQVYYSRVCILAWQTMSVPIHVKLLWSIQMLPLYLHDLFFVP